MGGKVSTKELTYLFTHSKDTSIDSLLCIRPLSRCLEFCGEQIRNGHCFLYDLMESGNEVIK
jgi:hypothetical protein